MRVRVERRLLKWGNGYGLRLTVEEVRRLGLPSEKRVRATVEGAEPINDLDRVALFNFGGRYDIRKILEEEAVRNAAGRESD